MSNWVLGPASFDYEVNEDGEVSLVLRAAYEAVEVTEDQMWMPVDVAHLAARHASGYREEGYCVQWRREGDVILYRTPDAQPAAWVACPRRDVRGVACIGLPRAGGGFAPPGYDLDVPTGARFDRTSIEQRRREAEADPPF